jgi:hypothetical protein
MRFLPDSGSHPDGSLKKSRQLGNLVALSGIGALFFPQK